jgi:hypothetical protein
VRLVARESALQVEVDGAEHQVPVAVASGWRGVEVEQPGPIEREYQVDGSDTTSTNDRNPAVMARLVGTPLYAFDAWLRDEGSYSRWEHLRVVDLANGQSIAADGPLPPSFQVDADLRRPEAPARLWLVGPTDDIRQGLELDRDRRDARWVTAGPTGERSLPRWFFPEQPLPFAAGLLELIGRAAAAAYALAVASWLLGGLVLPRRLALGSMPWAEGALTGWLLLVVLVSWRAYHQLPHILDAMAYTFQAAVFSSGRLALAAPPLPDAFKGPFQVIVDGRWFGQYPPGAAAAYAAGRLLSVEWLVGPLAALVMLVATGWTAARLHGGGARTTCVVLGALSPFVLFQAGSFLSHPIAAAVLSLALAAFVGAEVGARPLAYLACGGLLGAAFLVREAASVLFALPLAIRLLSLTRWRSLALVVAGGLPFLVIYLAYNASLTGNPLVLPRTLFDPADHFGFGDNIGFHTRHTLAAGLVNTDEQLTLLQLDLFGWPPLFALGLLGLPFLTGRVRAWDEVAAAGTLAFVVAYTAYFYHGIALGPRYYFEALPWMLLLAGRGAQTLVELARGSPLGALVPLALLCLNTVLFYLPNELSRRADYSALPNGRTADASAFVEPSLGGPRLASIPTPALVLTDDWWLYNQLLASLNCPTLPNCPVLFALATNDDDRQQLRAAYPGRTNLRVVDRGGTLSLE